MSFDFCAKDVAQMTENWENSLENLVDYTSQSAEEIRLAASFFCWLGMIEEADEEG